MLTADDVAWIKENRKEITVNRTEAITIVRREKVGEDPYTKEPIYDETDDTVDVVWKKYSTVANNDRDVIGGIELLEGDVLVTFSPDLNPYEITKIIRRGDEYKIVTVDDKGLGGLNRYECVVRRVT